MDDQNRKLAGLILNCKPRDIRAISTRADGSLAVVAPNGMKFIFSPVELENARDSFGLLATGNPLAEPVEASGGRPDISIHAQKKALRGTVAGSAASAGSATGNPLAEPVEASGGRPDISIHAQQKTLRGTVAGSAASAGSATGRIPVAGKARP